jgi:peptidoglycan DL-endopeptidase CwlO
MRVLLIVVAAFSTACAASTPRPFPGRGPTTPVRNATPGTSTTSTGYEVSGTALEFRGTPYRNGGADPTGFDCSGFVWYVFGQHGLAVPRTVQDQFRIGESIPASDLRAGDLVFFSTTSSGPSHVGIVIGGDSFVHAPSSSGVVRVERLGASYWASRFVGARRIL